MVENFAEGDDKNGIAHIFFGEGGKHPGGYHSENIKPKNVKVIESTRGVPDKYGVYEARIEIDGVQKTSISSFYPQGLSNQKIVDEVEYALKNAVQEGTANNVFTGTASNGMKIRIILGKNKKISVAFPLSSL